METSKVSSVTTSSSPDCLSSATEAVRNWLTLNDIDPLVDLAGWFSASPDFLTDEELGSLSEYERLELRSLWQAASQKLLARGVRRGENTSIQEVPVRGFPK